MIDPAFSVNILPALGQLDLAQKQVAYAASLAINDAALSCMRGMKYVVQDGRFTLRNDRITKGFRVKMSTKRNLTAHVFHLDESMLKQEYPGIKRGRSGHRIGVPAKLLRPGGRDSARTSTNRIRKADWPSNALKRPEVFARDRKGRPIKIDGHEVMMVRRKGTAKSGRKFGTGLARSVSKVLGKRLTKRRVSAIRKALYAGSIRGRGRILSREVRVMFLMPTRATIRARLGMYEFVRDNAPATVIDRFPYRYAEALATAYKPYSAG